MSDIKEPVWIRQDVVRAIHERQLSEHGGDAGIRDEGLLQSALARPQNVLAYSDLPADLAALAAAYAHGIAANHPFVDGNKRTAYVVYRTFLKLNGADLYASAEDKYLCFLRLAAGELDVGELAEWIRERLQV